MVFETAASIKTGKGEERKKREVIDCFKAVLFLDSADLLYFVLSCFDLTWSGLICVGLGL